MLGRTNGDLETTARTCFPPEIDISMSLEAAMMRYCGNMATIDESAGTRARDSARPAARRPGPRNRTGAVSVLGRLQRRLRDGERVPFCTKIHFLSRVRFTNSIMAKGDLAPENAHNEGVEHGMKTRIFAFVRRDDKVSSCIIILSGNASLMSNQHRFAQSCPELGGLRLPSLISDKFV